MNDQAPRFQHVQPGPAAYEEVYRDTLEYLNGAIRQMSSSPHLYTTKQTAIELEKTADYLAILKLENNLFHNATTKWREKFCEREIVTQRQALLRLKNRLTDPGGQFLARYKANMNYGNARCTSAECAQTELSKLTDQEDGIGWTSTSSIRAAHAWAEQELKALNAELGPLAEAAQCRIQQYSDVMDITNRYAGYRRNMGYLKKSDPNDLQAFHNALEMNTRPPMAPRWHLGEDWQRAEAAGTQHYTAPGDWEDCRVDQRSFMERYESQEDPRKAAGIALNFPGKSEYQENFMLPTHVETGMIDSLPRPTHRSKSEQPLGARGRGSMVGIDPSQVQLKGYLVNPRPNYLSDYGPTAKENEELKIPFPETYDNFRWPDVVKPKTVPLLME